MHACIALLIFALVYCQGSLTTYCKGSRIHIPKHLLDLTTIQKGKSYPIQVDYEDNGAIESAVDFFVDEPPTSSPSSLAIRLECHDTVHKYNTLPILDLCFGLIGQKSYTRTLIVVMKSAACRLLHLQPSLYLISPLDLETIDTSLEIAFNTDFLTTPSEIIDWISEDGTHLAAVPR